MKRVLRISGVAVLGLAALVALACGGDEDSGPFSKFLSRYHKAATGTVSKLDKDKKTMVVTNKKGVPVDITWTDQTKVTGELAEGANVTVKYKMKSHANIATAVKVNAAAGGPATSPAATASPATPSEGAGTPKPETKK